MSESFNDSAGCYISDFRFFFVRMKPSTDNLLLSNHLRYSVKESVAELRAYKKHCQVREHRNLFKFNYSLSQRIVLVDREIGRRRTEIGRMQTKDDASILKWKF